MRLPILTIGLLFSLASYTQVINVEALRIVSDTTGWFGGLGTEFSIQKNTTLLYNLSTNVHAQHKGKKNLWLAVADVEFLDAGGESFVNNGYTHLRFNRKLNYITRWEAFSQLQYNNITKIDLRWLIGTGPRFKLLHGEINKAYLGVLLMHEYEEESKGTIQKNQRIGSYLSFNITPTKNIKIVSTTYFQPIIKDLADYRASTENSLEVALIEKLALTVTYNLAYDSTPFKEVPSTTYSLTNGLKWKF